MCNHSKRPILLAMLALTILWGVVGKVVYDTSRNVRDSNNSMQQVYEPGTVLKTVAHLDLTDREDLTLIFSDLETDIAYYEYTPNSNHVKKGDTFYTVNGDAVEVTGVDALGFFVTYNNAFHAGMSGSSIVNDEGEIRGIISSMVDGKYVFCLWP